MGRTRNRSGHIVIEHVPRYIWKFIPDTAGVEIDADSDEIQAWYFAFTSFPPSVLLESDAKLNEILSRHFEDTNRTGRKKQGPLYVVERWGDIKVVLLNKLTKIKSKLRTNLATEISSQSDPINNPSILEKR